MKKLLTPLLSMTAACLLLFSASSCTREYKCECVMTYSGVPGLPDSTVRDYPITDTKKNAKSMCEANSNTYKDGNITTVERCYLW